MSRQRERRNPSKTKAVRAHHLRTGQTNRINTLMELLGTYKIRSHCLFCAFSLRARRGRGIPTRCAGAMECAAAIRGTPVTRRSHRDARALPQLSQLSRLCLSTHFPKIMRIKGKNCHSKRQPSLAPLKPNLKLTA